MGERATCCGLRTISKERRASPKSYTYESSASQWQTASPGKMTKKLRLYLRMWGSLRRAPTPAIVFIRGRARWDFGAKARRRPMSPRHVQSDCGKLEGVFHLKGAHMSRTLN